MYYYYILDTLFAPVNRIVLWKWVSR